MIYYEGHREHSGAPNTVRRIDPATGAAVALDWRLDVRNHSPTGLEWGYGGSGPAQLALALCVDALDGDVAHARRIYQHVKWKLVAHFDREDWTVSASAIRSLIGQIEDALRGERWNDARDEHPDHEHLETERSEPHESD